VSAAVVRRCYGRVARLRLHVDVERAVIRAINAAAPGPGQALLNAGLETRLREDVVLARASTAFLNFAAFNLSDDLSDGDCTYLPSDEAAAVVLILDNVFFSAMRTLGLAEGVEDEIVADLLAAEEAQVLEIKTTAWGAERLTAVTDGIAGRQWSAYLKLLWAGTPLAPRADSIARGLGRVGLLAGDIRTGDARYTGLAVADRQVVLEQALAGVRELEAEQLSFLGPTLAASTPVLLEERARTAVAGEVVP
jgi:hypothetical protein